MSTASQNSWENRLNYILKLLSATKTPLWVVTPPFPPCRPKASRAWNQYSKFGPTVFKSLLCASIFILPIFLERAFDRRFGRMNSINSACQAFPLHLHIHQDSPLFLFQYTSRPQTGWLAHTRNTRIAGPGSLFIRFATYAEPSSQLALVRFGHAPFT
jgi:hypothetical protein